MKPGAMCYIGCKLLQAQVDWRTVLLRRARRVRRNSSCSVAYFHQPVLNEILLQLFTTDIGEHFPVYLHARRKRLATLGFHFPTESGVLDDVFSV